MSEVKSVMYNVVFVYWNRKNRCLELITAKSVLEQKERPSRRFICLSIYFPSEFKSVKETQL